jgi:hypothetical protein
MSRIGGGIASLIWAQCSLAQISTNPPSLIGLHCTAEQVTADILSKPNFPTGATANPTLTLAALALRTADQIRTQV